MQKETSFYDPYQMFLYANKEDKTYFHCYPVLNRIFGPEAGILLSYMLHQQWRIEKDPETKRRFPVYFQSVKEFSEQLGFSQKKIKKALDHLRKQEIISTKRKGWPAKNNFWFNQAKLSMILDASPHIVEDPIGPSI
jgi:hypothetical protein